MPRPAAPYRHPANPFEIWIYIDRFGKRNGRTWELQWRDGDGALHWRTCKSWTTEGPRASGHQLGNDGQPRAVVRAYGVVEFSPNHSTIRSLSLVQTERSTPRITNTQSPHPENRGGSNGRHEEARRRGRRSPCRHRRGRADAR